jgi:hypothetical protein
MLDISKYSLYGVLSVIFAFNVLLYAIFQIIVVVTLRDCIILEGLFIVLTFLNSITLILGLIAAFIMNDDLGKTGIYIGVIGFYLNLINFSLCHMGFFLD